MSEICREIQTGPSAWTGTSLKGDSSWIYHLSEAEIEALDQAFNQVSARGLIGGEFGKEDFPLGAFGTKLAAVDQDIREGRGFALIKGFPVDRYPLEDIKTIYWGIGCHLGTVLANNVQGEYVSAVTDAGEQPFDNNRRVNTTNKILDPHTDPTDIVILLCIEKAKEGGSSSLSSSISVHNELLRNHPEYLEPLYAGFRRDERGMTETRDPEAVSDTVPVYEYVNGNLNCFYGRNIIKSGAKKAGQELTPLQEAAVDEVAKIAVREDMRVDMLLEPGDIQVINNFRTLHARTAYVDNDDGRKRYLLRMWINILNGTQLSPEFAAFVRRGVLPSVSRPKAEAV